MPAIKTVIYLDVLLLVNFLVAYFLLQAAGLLSSQHAAFSRMVCASGIASLSALILFAPELSYPAQILYKILTACAVVGVAFGLQGAAALCHRRVLVCRAQHSAGRALHCRYPAHRHTAAANGKSYGIPAHFSGRVAAAFRSQLRRGVAGIALFGQHAADHPDDWDRV